MELGGQDAKMIFFQKEGEEGSVMKAIQKHSDSIRERLDCELFNTRDLPASEVVIKTDEDEIDDVKFQFTITRA